MNTSTTTSPATGTPPEPATAGGIRRPRGRRLVAVLTGVAVLLVAGIGGWLVLRPASDDGSTDAPAASAPITDQDDPVMPEAGTYGTSVLPAPGASAPSDVPASVLAEVPGRPLALPPVSLDAPVAHSDGVTARLADIKAITVEAQGLGETSGPALAVVVELTNGSDAPVSLDTVAVNMVLGADGSPASRIQAGSGTPFSGSLAPGATVQAVYAFRVALEQRDVVTVTVGHSFETGTAVFSGAVA